MHVMFRLVGGDASPPSPSLNPPLEATKDDELQATMLQLDDALKQSPTLKKLDELMKSKTIELQHDPALIKTSLAAFIKMVIANLNERFDNSSHNSIFEVTKIFMPENLPSDLAMLVYFGAKEVIALARFYKIRPDPIETEALEDEWRNFSLKRSCQPLQSGNWIGPLSPRSPEQYLVSMLKTQL